MILCIYSARFGRLRRVATDDSKTTQQAWEMAGTGVGVGEAHRYVPLTQQGYTFSDLQAIVTQQTGLDPEVLGDYFATVVNGVVVDYGNSDPACGDFPTDPAGLMVQVPGIGLGYTYDGKVFTPPVPTPEELANMARKGVKQTVQSAPG